MGGKGNRPFRQDACLAMTAGDRDIFWTGPTFDIEDFVLVRTSEKNRLNVEWYPRSVLLLYGCGVHFHITKELEDAEEHVE